MGNTKGKEPEDAHLFDLETGDLLATFLSDETNGWDIFGGTVRLTKHYAVVSAYLDDEKGINGGLLRPS